MSFKGIELAELVKVLEKAEGQGIGLRREEGFGRVAFNHPVHDKNLTSWNAGALDLSPLGRGGEKHEFHHATALIQFTLDWMEQLDKDLKQDSCNDQRFEAVARLLHASRLTSADSVKQEMRRMGRMTELLPEELKGRDKKNFFETDGRKGMEAIDRLLDEMVTLMQQQMLEHDPQAWRIGLQMLAARIAEPARKKAQERR